MKISAGSALSRRSENAMVAGLSCATGIASAEATSSTLNWALAAAEKRARLAISARNIRIWGSDCEKPVRFAEPTLVQNASTFSAPIGFEEGAAGSHPPLEGE